MISSGKRSDPEKTVAVAQIGFFLLFQILFLNQFNYTRRGSFSAYGIGFSQGELLSASDAPSDTSMD